MYSKRRQLPLEVSSWMEKDLTLRKITANSRMLTNDTRQNIVLSRQFFSDLLNLSFSRYRKIAECDFDRKLFLRNQLNKSETSLPGLRPYVDQVNHSSNRITSSRIQSSRNDGNPLLYPSTQSFLSRPGTKSDPTFNRRQQSSIRQTTTALPLKPQADIMPTVNSTIPPIRQQISRDRLNRLAQPKGYRFKSAATDHTRSMTSDETTTTAEDLFGKIDQVSQITLPSHNILPDKPKSAADDKRFHHLVSSFSQIHSAQSSNLQTVKSIIQSNPSLQDTEGQWKLTNASVSSRKAEFKHNRQMLVDKLHSRLDVFLIDVAA